MYLLLFLVGMIGFVAMTALGFLHVGHHSGGGHVLRSGNAGGHSSVGHGGAGHAGSSHPVASHSVAGHAPNAHGSSGSSGTSQSQSPQGSSVGQANALGPAPQGSPALGGDSPSLWFAISPLDIFSLALGGGATGILLQGMFQGTALIEIAILGSLVFNFAMIRPLVNSLANFASRPSEGLEGMVAKGATALTKFDSEGRGLVRLVLDGQNVQVLARLEIDEVQRGVRVAKGDPLTIVEVDKTRNTCRVTRELTA